jgi:hypothetical protein
MIQREVLSDNSSQQNQSSALGGNGVVPAVVSIRAVMIFRSCDNAMELGQQEILLWILSGRSLCTLLLPGVVRN